MKANFILSIVIFALLNQCLAEKLNFFSFNKECDKPRLFSCAPIIKQTIISCANEDNAKGCIEELLEHSQCLPCVCNMLPDLCIDEEDETPEQEARIEKLNKQLKQNLISCNPSEIFKCKQHIKHTVEKCVNNPKCVNQQLLDHECHICLCTIAPQICEEAKIVDENIDRIEEQSKNPFEFLSYLLGMAGQTGQENAKSEPQKVEEESSLGSLFAFLDHAATFADKAQTMFNVYQDITNTKDEKKTQKKTKKDKKKQNQDLQQEEQQSVEQSAQSPNYLQEAMKMLASEQGSGLLSQFNLNKDDVKEQMQNQDFQSMYQQSMEKIMQNPQIMSKLLPKIAGGNFEIGDLVEIFGSDFAKKFESESQEPIVEQEEEEETTTIPTPKEEVCLPEFAETCKWEILRMLPLCMKVQVRPCLEELLESQQHCHACICNIVPVACE